MKQLLLALSLLLGVAAPLVAPRAQNLSDEGNPAENQASRPAALAYLKVLDDGRYTASYDLAGENLRATFTRKEWSDMVGAARKSVGALESRELVGVRHALTLDDGPPGNYYIAFYHTRYGGKDWQERVVMVLKGKAYRVEGYYIVPSDDTGTITK